MAPSVCFLETFCFACPIWSQVGPALDLPHHSGCGSCIVHYAINYVWPFNVCNLCNIFCDCPCGKKMTAPCFWSGLLDRMVDKYDLPYPEPCGDAQCCPDGTPLDCKCQVCCMCCTNIMIYRELETRGAIK